MELLVSTKTSYGITRVYPECKKSRLLANIAKADTLTEDVILAIKELGYTFKVKQEVI